MGIIEFFKKLLLREEVKKEKEERVPFYTVRELIAMTDFSCYPDPEIINPSGSITVMYMDDLHEIMETSMNDLEIIGKNMLDTPEKEKMFKEFRIVKCSGLYAGQIALKYSKHNKIDKAILDLTLGKEPIEFDNGQYLDINGDDIAIELFNKNPDIHLAIFSSHTLNKNNRQYREYMDNFEEFTGDNIMDHYIPRIGDRLKNIHDLLFTDRFKFKA